MTEAQLEFASVPPIAADVGVDDGALPMGALLADRYRVTRVLGEGGMGAVYLAEHIHMHKEFAVKVLHGEMCKMPEIVARFEREAVAAGSIDHPNVAAATDFGRLADGSFFLVLEYIAGINLRTALDDGALVPHRALRIVRGIALAVGAAHAKGIVHRDLKPENVMLVARDGDPDFVKVLDFGIAKLDLPPNPSGTSPGAGHSAVPLTRIGSVFGTPDYMAPEQALGETVDHRADLYAIGTILYELLCGERPFQGEAIAVLGQRVVNDAPPLPDAVVARIDPRVPALLRGLLARSVAMRTASAGELGTLLDEILSQSTPAAPGVGAARAMTGPSQPTRAPAMRAHGVAHAATQLAASAARSTTVIVRDAAQAINPTFGRQVTPRRVVAAAAACALVGMLSFAVLVRGCARPYGRGEPPAAVPTARGATETAPAYTVAVGPAREAPAAPPAEPPKATGGGGRRGIHIRLPW